MNIDQGNDAVLLLVDGHNLAYRSFFAIRSMSEGGQPTQALFGFVRALERLPSQVGATHLCVTFDGGLPPERRALLETYKAQRPKMPDALRSQFPWIEEYLDAAGIRHVRKDEVEADDLMATLARRAEADDAQVLLASTDRDLMQLVGPAIRMVEPFGKAGIMDAGAVERKTGVPPGQVLAWRALVGDASDNIPGVPGIGPKTATRLLLAFGGLDAMWADLERVEPVRVRSALADHRARVDRNLRLMALACDLSCPFSWRDCRIGPEDPERMRRLLLKAGFRSMLQERAQPRLSM